MKEINGMLGLKTVCTLNISEVTFGLRSEGSEGMRHGRIVALCPAFQTEKSYVWD